MNKLKSTIKPAVKRAIKRWKNAHIKDCDNCKKDEKSCIFYGYITNKDKCVYFENKVL